MFIQILTCATRKSSPSCARGNETLDWIFQRVLISGDVAVGVCKSNPRLTNLSIITTRINPSIFLAHTRGRFKGVTRA